jgi:hypothetical protein
MNPVLRQVWKPAMDLIHDQINSQQSTRVCFQVFDRVWCKVYELCHQVRNPT